MSKVDLPIIVIGAGPSGLACAATLAERGFEVLVVERNEFAGGMSQSIVVGEQVADLGNHLFSNRNPETNRLIQTLFPDGLNEFSHNSGFFWSGKLVPYPLSITSAISHLPLKLLTKAAGSLFQERISSRKAPENYKEQLQNQYGTYLEKELFSPYLAKTWGVNTDELSTLTQSGRAEKVRGSIGFGRAQKFFDFPDGNGGVYLRWQQDLSNQGVRFLTRSSVTHLEIKQSNISSINITCEKTGCTTTIPCSAVVSTLPLPKLVELLNHKDLLKEAPELCRTVVIVYLQYFDGQPFPFDTIYAFDACVQAVRVTDYVRRYGNASRNPRGLLRSGEYWLSPDDPRASFSDGKWREILNNDLKKLAERVGTPSDTYKVIRLRAAAPVPTISAMKFARRLRSSVSQFNNLYTVGRSGDLRYIDQDVAISSGFELGRTIDFEGLRSLGV